jgi:ATP-binding cassette subfamily B protein
MVLPFLGALATPDRIFQHPWAQPFVSLLGITQPQQLLLPVTLCFGLSAILAGAARLALLSGQTRLGNAIGNDIGSEAYRRTLYQPYSVHASRNSGEVIAVLMNKVNTVVYFVIIPWLTLVTSTFIVLVIVVFMVLVDPRLTAMALLGYSMAYSVLAYATKKRLLREGQRVTQGQSQVTQGIQEGLGGIRDVLIDGLQQTFFRIYRDADMNVRKSLTRIAVMGGAPRPVIEALGLVLLAILAYVLSTRQEGLATAIPVLGSLALASQRLLPMVQQGYAGWTCMLGGEASLRDVLALLEQPLPTYSTEPSPPPMQFRQQICLNNVSFRYTPQGPWVLSGITLEILRGRRVGFIGSTGSGKSTLLDIVMGLLVPTSGAIRIDGVPLDESNNRSWQAHIAHVPQAIFLTDATIAENIAFGAPREQIDFERVREASKRAHLAETIASWREGEDTLVGERGIRLSGGQRQRIGIARALYKRADVIVLDEATSALDSDTERAVMESIAGLGEELTVLIVAHRVSTLRYCDQIVELSGGAIKSIGSYQEVVDRLGRADAL